MEPVSYRASAVHYTHGDSLLVFNQDNLIGLLAPASASSLSSFLATMYKYPMSVLADKDKELHLRKAGWIAEWNQYLGARDMLKMTQSMAGVTANMTDGMKKTISDLDAKWNASVFVGLQQVAAGIEDACNNRLNWVRRFDPIRMSIEHETLKVEKLHGGARDDGKAVSVDVRFPDTFLKPNNLSALDESHLVTAIARRMDMLGFDEMRLVRDVRVCDYTFAYSRTSSSPSLTRDKLNGARVPVRLRLHSKVTVGDGASHPVLCIEQSNEGFYVRLKEQDVRNWLQANLVELPAGPPDVLLGGTLIEDYDDLDHDPDTRFSRFLEEYRRENSKARRPFPFVYTLLHTMAHHLILTASSMSGLDLGSFGEHLFVPDLAFLVYRRGTTMDLGNLSSMWRERSDPQFGNEVLEQMVNPRSLRCGSETVCNTRGGACPDCILLPEATCLTRNELLSRSVLVGRGKPSWDAVDANLIGFYDLIANPFLSAPA